MKSKHRTLRRALYWVLALAALMICGAALDLFDRLVKIPVLIWCVYYCLWAAAVLLLAVRPVLRTMTAPPVRGFGKAGITGAAAKNPGAIAAGLEALYRSDTTAYGDYVKNLFATIPLTAEERARQGRLKNTNPEEIAFAAEIIHSRYTEMRRIIKDAAVANFAITTVSQNAVTDFLSSVVININMIDDLVRCAGGGPSFYQKLKLYGRIGLDAFIITKIDDIVSDLSLIDIKPLNLILSSVINGAMNAFVSLRVGYTVIAYLEKGSGGYRPEEAKGEARTNARAAIAAVVKEGVSQTTARLGRGISGFFQEGVGNGE